MSTILQDVRYGFRMLWKSPGFTFVAVLALALGIGANSAIFSVVNAVLLRPLPYTDPDRLVVMWERDPTMDTSVAYPNFKDWRDQNQSFESIAAFRRDSFNLTGAGEPERLSGRMTSAVFFQTLGVTIDKGRTFRAEEDRAGADPVVILSHGFWQRRFGGDESILSKQLTLNNRSYTVIGITPPTYRYGAEVDLFVPIGLFEENYQQRGSHPGIYVIGRLKPGVSHEQARADMNTIFARLGQQYPNEVGARTIRMESLYENTVQDVRPALLILLGAVAFVLLIACANVANLLLARSAARQKEIAIRTALGAGRWRVIRQLLTESVLLSLAGGAAGLLLALWGTDFLTSAVPDNIPRLAEAGVDTRVLAFTTVVSILTGIIFGLAPALQASKPDLNETLKEGDRGSTGGRHRVRNVLVVVQTAIALVLLIGAGLMVKSFNRLQGVETGFDSSNVLTMQISVPAAKDEGKKVYNLFEQLQQRIKSVPGVESVALTNGLPMAGATETSFWVEGRPRASERDFMMSVMYMTTTDYFKTMGIAVKRGRVFTEQDRQGTPPVAVIDEKLAEKAFPGEDPIGKRLTFDRDMAAEIVGVVSHVKQYGLDGEVPVEPQFYLSINQAPEQFLPNIARRILIVARTRSEPLAVADAIRREVLATDKNQPVFGVRTMDDIIAQSVASRRFAMMLLAVFAGVALVLAAVGIYGVMAYSVTQRTHEIGIRMALGAQARDILRLVVGQGMMLALIGVALGLIAAFGLTRVMTSMLYGVSATDPLTFASISVLLAFIALLACYIPARRATRVDPMIALRYE
ncbi:MAG TPA: ABC transporter permease [Pyrinomonadaceae bacterium]|nr:ABC transporter permease [Pyrinomonadaceae bacterium]